VAKIVKALHKGRFEKAGEKAGEVLKNGAVKTGKVLEEAGTATEKALEKVHQEAPKLIEKGKKTAGELWQKGAEEARTAITQAQLVTGKYLKKTGERMLKKDAKMPKKEA